MGLPTVAGPGEGGEVGDDEKPLPEGWTKNWSNTWKKNYYFNGKTGKQIWDHPSSVAAASSSPAPPSSSGSRESAQPVKRESAPVLFKKEGVAVKKENGGGEAGTKRKAEDPHEDQDAKRRRAQDQWGMGPGDSEHGDVREEEGEDTPELAVLRDKEVRKLLALLRTLCSRSQSISKEPGNALTRFLFLSALDARRMRSDPLLPVDGVLDTCLHRELLKAGVEPEECDAACRKLSDAASDSARLVEAGRQRNSRSVRSYAAEVQEKETPQRQLQIIWRDTTLLINREHYLKIQKLYVLGNHDSELFKVRLFCLLHRYETIGGAGYQAAVPSAVFTTLKEEFGVTHECFASPLNQSLSSYSSAFADTDHFFGSCGSYFDMSRREWAKGGSFEANPPFVEESMQLMADQIHQTLEDNAEVATSFVVVVPCWTDERGHEMLRESRFLRKHIILDKSQHSYRSGAQHTSIQQYHDAGFRTSLFIVQNDAGAGKWPVTAQAVTRLEESFRKWD